MKGSISESSSGAGLDSDKNITEESTTENSSRSELKAKSKGPRTFRGKQRSKYNALKSGIFARFFLDDDEHSLYTSLFIGFRDYYQPEGEPEIEMVEKLAMIKVREYRFLKADRAEIAKAIEFERVGSLLPQLSEVWDLMREGDTSGGMLRNRSNPFVIQTAIELLKDSRDRLEKLGFERSGDPWLLRKLYGLDQDRKVPHGSTYWKYEVCRKHATNPPKGNEPAVPPDELKKEMIQILNREIEHLAREAQELENFDLRRRKYQTAVALVPSRDVMDRHMKYEAHLSREFDRTLSQLERLQRARLGKPVPPRLVVDINHHNEAGADAD